MFLIFSPHAHFSNDQWIKQVEKFRKHLVFRDFNGFCSAECLTNETVVANQLKVPVRFINNLIKTYSYIDFDSVLPETNYASLLSNP
jgi:hypothetical protein